MACDDRAAEERVLAGVVVGVAMLVGAELLRARTKPGWIHALSGVGLAVLYVAAYASAAWYELVPTEVAFGATTVIMALGGALAWRYRGEAILVLVLVAGFLTPVLLSTGEDRPLALFSYLLLLTSGALFVSAQRGFRVAIGLAVAGVLVMAFGWYDKFFDVHDWRGEHWAGDKPPEELIGGYFGLGTRAVPLLFVALFSTQWFLTAEGLRRLDRLKGWVVPLGTVAAVFLHGAVCALLYDQPLALGIAVLAVGLASVLGMRALDATRWLVIPMAVAFVVLAGLSQEQRGTDQLILLGLLGLWAAVYAVAFIKDALARNPVPSAADALRTQLAILGFAALACLMLLPEERVTETAVAVVAAAAGAAFVAHRARQPVLLLVAQLVTLLGLLAAAGVALEDRALAWHPGLIAMAATWGVVFAAAGLNRAESEDGKPAFAAILVGALAPLGALAVGLISTGADAPTLRAILTAAAGAASLGMATAVAGRGPAWADWTSTLAALALGLFAAAVAFGLSGAPVTVLWAILAAIAGTLAARSQASVWLAAFQLLVAATVLRLLAVDVADAAAALRAFEWSRGAEGVLAFPTFFTPRAYALLGTGAAFLVAGVMASRRAGPPKEPPSLGAQALRPTGALVMVLGYIALTALAITEVQSALSSLPAAPPMVLDDAEFSVFWETVVAARVDQAATLDVAATVVLGLVGLALLGIGFGVGDPFHRYLGLAFLLLTIGKLVVWDVWKVSRIARVVVLTVIGALLLTSGFLYARLKVLFTKGMSSTTALFLVALAAGAARAEDTPVGPPVEAYRYQHMAPLEGIGPPGDHRLVVPAPLFDKSKTRPRLEDLRLADAEGRMVPFLVRDVPPERPTGSVQGRLLDPGLLPDGRFRATFELPTGTEHCEVELDLSGPAPYLRRVTVETGSDPQDFQTVAHGAVIYAVSAGGAQYGRRLVRYPLSAQPYLRVTLGDDPDAQTTRIEGAQVSCRPPPARTPWDEHPLTIVETTRDDAAKSTIITLDAGQDGLPIERIQLQVESPAELVRRAEVAASAYKQAWPVEGSGVLYRVAGEAPSEDLTLSLSPAGKRYFQVTVRDEDNPPLKITGAVGSWRRKELVFRTEAEGPVTVYVGQENDDLPRFDLQDILRRRVGRAELQEARLGPLTANPRYGKPGPERTLPLTEQYRGVIGIAVAVLVLGLGLWAVRLLRRAPEGDA
ncbi:MAG: DUF2339 domain-containing protein [Myxococcales bacterium]|nr:DUF2339 domain-containing protein [Myxococcales bacterium]